MCRHVRRMTPPTGGSSGRRSMDRMNKLAQLWRCAPALLLAGCGGGIYLEFGDGFDDPPQVDLVASAPVVEPQQQVRLVAAAVDDSGFVSQVAFYRYDGGQAVRWSVDATPPFEALLVVPDDGRRQLSLFARATDGQGQQADSPLLHLEIRP